MGGQKQVRLCETADCPLFPYRFGKNPNRKGIGGHTKTRMTGKKRQSDNIIGTTVPEKGVKKEIDREIAILKEGIVIDSKKKIRVIVEDVE